MDVGIQYTIYKNLTKNILGEEGYKNLRMIITGHLTWKDWSWGIIQDFHG